MFKVEYNVVFNRGLRDERFGYAEAFFSSMENARDFARQCGENCLDWYETDEE